MSDTRPTQAPAPFRVLRKINDFVSVDFPGGPRFLKAAWVINAQKGGTALLVRHWLPWAVLGFDWIQVFLTNMVMKEASMARYPEWGPYRARTGMLVPRPWAMGRRGEEAP
jgi:hypothetical protein